MEFGYFQGKRIKKLLEKEYPLDRGGQGPEEQEMNRFDVIVRDRVLEFTRDVEEFVKKKEIVSCSFQRNVFYERKEGEFVDRLKEIWTAFVVWKGSVGEGSSSSGGKSSS